VASKPVVLEPHAGVGVPAYLVTLVRARKRDWNFASRMLWPKARGPLWFGD
jgi:hypothetical protein